jgi:DNA polymerase
VIKCRPPGNRDPEPDELAACDSYLDRQIAALNPKVIVTLGRFSMAKFFPNAKISAIHGQAKQVGGRLVVAMFHPAAALHQPKFKDPLVEDFKKLPGFIAQADKAAAAQQSSDEPPAEQLSLF